MSRNDVEKGKAQPSNAPAATPLRAMLKQVGRGHPRVCAEDQAGLELAREEGGRQRRVERQLRQRKSEHEAQRQRRERVDRLARGRPGEQVQAAHVRALLFFRSIAHEMKIIPVMPIPQCQEIRSGRDARKLAQPIQLIELRPSLKK
jgi:hypothetical protein